MNLVFASNNAHKLAEVREIMPAGINVLSLKDIGFESEIEETGSTLAENSLIKAKAVYDWLLVNGRLVIDGVFADDTGLEIDALNGEPGVYTARWAELETGVHLPEMETYAANRAKALRELADKVDRGCQFKTVITLIRCTEVGIEGQKRIQVEGVVRGVMTEEERGTSGFGYDAIFKPEGYDKTFGELPSEVKNNISHRARALEELVKVLEC
ncbi:MAG: RdgB/HAM1 family non-canonical purine NTP pyrophosphatase [Paludibacteraceae bacterium]|nr:RdgB/HAM1 family non-canonical purine NTP pyrophosphatase [Paludibacteraceae bacterium]